jgi:hypothetical protein
VIYILLSLSLIFIIQTSFDHTDLNFSGPSTSVSQSQPAVSESGGPVSIPKKELKALLQVNDYSALISNKG